MHRKIRACMAAIGAAMLVQYLIPIMLVLVPTTLLGAPAFKIVEYYCIGVTVLALPTVVFIGLPMYLAMREAGWTSDGQVQGAGALIAVIPAQAILGYWGGFTLSLWVLVLFAVHGAAGAAALHGTWESVVGNECVENR